MKKYIHTTILLLIAVSLHAQDPIFTQYFMVPQTINPGFTGFMETTSVGVMHRSQWPTSDLKITSNYAFLNTWSEEMTSGFGISFLSQRESFTDYNLSLVTGSYAYRVEISDDWYFHPAIEVGYGRKSYGFQNLVLEDQLNIGTGTVSTVSMDPLALNNKAGYFDIGAGFLFNNEECWVGGSLRHLNRPDISFTQAGNVPLDMFFSVNAGYEFKFSNFMNTFLPFDSKLLITGNYMQQGNFNRFDLSAGIIFERVFVGVTAATNPARNAPNGHLLTSVNPYFGLKYESLKIGYSYDANTSGIGRTGGIHEFSMLYQFDWQKKCDGCPDYY
ncbi:PorP/SprF family type IX secretion system membrane protein [Flavobacterium sp. J372]|uniref:PorP/SprF family type IX secretion system membrane protein n=1 Tax=Flavobacterium sp. J372 TaxID=2898436 RepID=UPI0021508DAA|nr:PorP/SprF family type IX secretion system membrane protein [Flavobacterium sp. J372]MCR5861003.1 PorP/SprF family type IX secretion system membrane protein [Flavobacterium sp. J372]